MPNLVAISQTVAETWLFFEFQMSADCHLGFLKLQNFNIFYRHLL